MKRNGYAHTIFLLSVALLIVTAIGLRIVHDKYPDAFQRSIPEITPTLTLSITPTSLPTSIPTFMPTSAPTQRPTYPTGQGKKCTNSDDCSGLACQSGYCIGLDYNMEQTTTN